jgi:transcriptional regulator GlxA family with amidase domain
MNPKTQLAVDFMNANLHRKLSLSELAKSVNISRSHLCYLFKTQTGMTPGQYLMMLRMQKACELLATSLLSVKQIMLEVGYNSKAISCVTLRKFIVSPPPNTEQNTLTSYWSEIILPGEIVILDNKW